jgi:hypothetical protein
MPGDLLIDDLATQGRQMCERASFIRADEAGIAHDIRRHDCCQSPNNPLARHGAIPRVANHRASVHLILGERRRGVVPSPAPRVW